MLSKTEFNMLLAERGTLIIDGALATELEARGHDLNHELWSAIVLRDSPESIQQVHLDYYLAGADVAITASYQASTQGLFDHFQMDETAGMELIKESVVLAQKARAEAIQGGVKRHMLIAGSVGPYGAYLADGSEYRGDYERTKEEFQTFHRPRIQALVDAGVDLLGIETMPKLEEIEAVLDLLHEEFPGCIAWLGCTLQDDAHLSDGTPLEKVVEAVEAHPDQIIAIGINCVPTKIVHGALQKLKSLTQLPLLCYPNSGETWDAANHVWLGGQDGSPKPADEARAWHDAGARLIGGCCRTGPRFIQEISGALSSI